MLTPTGFVTDAWLMVNMCNHWSSYYKWLQKGKWSWLALARQFVRLVRAVLCEFQSDSGKWKSTCLLLSTDTTLTAEQVIESYGLRWSIESMFNQLKLAWGMKEAWQQTRQTLHR